MKPFLDKGLVKGLRITRISAYQVDLPLHEKSYKWSGGKSVDVFDSTVVRVETNAGVSGHGENTPLGPAYLPAFAMGTRAGIAALVRGARLTSYCLLLPNLTLAALLLKGSQSDRP